MSFGVNEVGVDACFLEGYLNSTLNLLLFGLLDSHVVFRILHCLGNAVAVNGNGIH